MATVYLARLSGVAGFQRMVAIKRLHPHLQRETEFVEMFLDEARLAARIHHPNVVPILEVGQSDRGYYLVMEYIEGDTMARLFARSAQAGKRVPPEIGTRIALDALAGLHAAHELKDDNDQPLQAVHRDVSPQNILVGIDGTSRITDFGVARAASRLSSTRSGQLKGKLSYMAPEQARGGAIDRRADVFAMGIVLWETLAFKRLFKGDGEAETLNRVLYEDIPTLRSAVPTIPAALDAVVMKSLERDPDKRFATAAEFGEALEQAARSLRALSSTRDVASCLDSVMGTELTTQREAVRAWIARSEPSRHSTGPRVAEPLTRVERTPSTLSKARLAVPNNVSSVSSAVIQVPPPPGSSSGHFQPVQSEVPPAASVTTANVRARPRLIGSAALLLVVGVLLGWGVVRWRAGPSTKAVAHTEAKPPASSSLAASLATNAPQERPSTAADHASPQVPLTATAQASASVSTPRLTSAPHPPPGPRSARSGTRPPVGPPDMPPTATTQPTGVAPPPPPDDISHNPYR